MVQGEKQYEQKEQKPADTDYISGIREELLGIENSAAHIEGLTESQWVAIRAAHRLLGEYIEKEQRSVEWNEEDELMAISIIDVLKQFEHRGAADMKIDWLENRLKFLCPQPKEDKFQEAMRMADKFEEGYEAGVHDTKAKAWKPNETQMKVLKLVADKDGTCLQSLYNDLKKLM